MAVHAFVLMPGHRFNLAGIWRHVPIGKFFVLLYVRQSIADTQKRCHSLLMFSLGAPVGLWVKREPTDLAVPSSSFARGEIFLAVKGVKWHTIFHYHPPIVLIWMEYYWKGRKIGSRGDKGWSTSGIITPHVMFTVHVSHIIVHTQIS